MSTTYRVVVRREDGAWLADVPALEGAHTYARTLETLDRYVREVIVMAADLPDEAMASLDLAYEYHTGDVRIDDATAQLRAERARVQREERHLAERTAAVAQRLVKDHAFSVRDAAALLNVSPQRISQVVPGRSKKAS